MLTCDSAILCSDRVGKTGVVVPNERKATLTTCWGRIGVPRCSGEGTSSREANLCCLVQAPNMSTKAPIYLKRGSRKGKKEKLRDILSSDMISPPLGDFRHTIHIGSGGGENDLFGDLSFLQGKFHLLPGWQGSGLSQLSSQCQEPFQLNRTASVCGCPPSSENSPLLKNAISLPVIGGVQALTLPPSAPAPVPDPLPGAPLLPSQAPPPKPPRLHLDDKGLPSVQDASFPTAMSSGVTLPLTSPSSGPLPDTDQGSRDPEDPTEQPYLSHAGSLLSLHLDLGPSILDDVLQIMDKHRVSRRKPTFADCASVV
ncbi:cdc42 effector protein 2-like [Scleropages formosus]|uniref:Cdc42 effector protein 2-like n=1 Tax=Scleropages formosus TaxID=113540 RepID=A0A0P7Y6E2_SCLFO|nr:cdc42 effector protein 2-like [Scleropages formosus]